MHKHQTHNACRRAPLFIVISSHDVLEIIINLYLLFIISHDGGDGRRRVNSGNRSVVGTWKSLEREREESREIHSLDVAKNPVSELSVPSISLLVC